MEYLTTVRNRILDNLSKLRSAPSVPFHATPGEAPRAAAEREAAERGKDERDPDARYDEDRDAEGEGEKPRRDAGAAAAPQDAEPVPSHAEAMQTDAAPQDGAAGASGDDAA